MNEYDDPDEGFEDEDLDTVEELLEEMEDYDDDEQGEEDDDDDEAAERRRRRIFRPKRIIRYPTKAKGAGYYARLVKGYATKKQLQAALARVGKDVRRNRTAISVNKKRITGVSRATTSNRRLVSSQSKAIRSVRKDVDATKQLFLLTSLLGGDQSFKLKNPVTDSGGDTIAAGTELEFVAADKMDKLLPLLMMGGLGGGKGGMMDNPLMLILLMDGLGK